MEIAYLNSTHNKFYEALNISNLTDIVSLGNQLHYLPFPSRDAFLTVAAYIHDTPLIMWLYSHNDENLVDNPDFMNMIFRTNSYDNLLPFVLALKNHDINVTAVLYENYYKDRPTSELFVNKAQQYGINI